MNFLDDELIKFLILLIIVVAIIFCIRVFFKIIIFIFSKIYLKNKLLNKKNIVRTAPNAAIFKKEEDELSRSIKQYRNENEKLIFENVQKINEEFEEKVRDIEQSDRIIGIVKPIGFWTSLILGDQLTEILGKAKALNSRSKKGFWISMLETQAKNTVRKGNLIR